MKYLYRFKMVAKYPIFISRHFDFGQNLKKKKKKKKHFSKGIFQWNLAQIRDHEYINIVEIKLGFIQGRF